MSKYKAYSPDELNLLLHEPWEISDQPYKLHAAFALSCLYDCAAPEPIDEDCEQDFDVIWGQTVPKSTLERLVKDIAVDFNDAADNYKRIAIWGKNYSIRKVNAYDHNRLTLIFDFPFSDGQYTITKEGVLNLAGETPNSLSQYETSRQQAQANIAYLRKIIMLAEDDDNNGWDKLTDMEIVMYCWAQFYNKHQFNNLIQFQQDYRDYLYVSERDIMSCFNEKAALRSTPIGLYTFSADRVMEWNNNHHQQSVAFYISDQDASDYWYETALKTTFLPMDQK